MVAQQEGQAPPDLRGALQKRKGGCVTRDVIIYGIFYRQECLYVGQTRYPGYRERIQLIRFRNKIGALPEFVILKRVCGHRANSAEYETIQEFRQLGQAKFNVRPYTEGNPNPRKNKPIKLQSPTQTSISIEEKLLRRVAKTAYGLKQSVSQWVSSAAEEKLSREAK